MTYKSLLLLFVTMIAVLLVSISCERAYRKNYYLLDYSPSFSSEIEDCPKLPYKVVVQEFGITRTYDRTSIVIRKSLHQLRYSQYNLWPIRPQDAIQNLLTQHLQQANIFEEVRNEFLDVRPKYSITGNIYHIELYESEEVSKADIEVGLTLEDNKNGEVVVSHHFARSERMYNNNMAFFAKKISDILKEENNKFIRKVLDQVKEGNDQ